MAEEEKQKIELEMPKAAEPKEQQSERIEADEQYIYKRGRSITFSFFSPKMIKKMASAKIVTPDLYDKEGYPVDGGFMDIRLGVIDPGLRSKTCGGGLRECMGHFGFLDFARPLIHLNYVDIVLNLLRCTCRECGKLLSEKPAKIVLEDEEEKDDEEDDISTKKQVKSFSTSVRNIKKC